MGDPRTHQGHRPNWSGEIDPQMGNSAGKSSIINNLNRKYLAERGGFEPPVRQTIDSADDTERSSTRYYT